VTNGGELRLKAVAQRERRLWVDNGSGLTSTTIRSNKSISGLKE